MFCAVGLDTPAKNARYSTNYVRNDGDYQTI